MNRISILILSWFLTTNVFAQNEEIWYVKYDSISKESCGYVDKDNNLRIPFGKYRMCFTDTFKTYAIVLKDKEGFIGGHCSGELGDC